MDNRVQTATSLSAYERAHSLQSLLDAHGATLAADIYAGDRLVLREGTRIRATQIGLAASIGRDHLPTRPHPRVVVLSAGPDLVEPGQPLKNASDEFETNSWLLTTAVREVGAVGYRVHSIPDNEEQLLVIDGVSLVEPRKGPRVTESTSRSSGRPFIGVPVGGVFVGASGRSSSKSTSVSTPAVDELTLVEEGGRFIASSQGIAYVGEMFNRKADYSAIIDWTGEGFQLRISASNKGTNWIVIFSRPGDMWVAGALLDAADEIPARALDTSGKATAPEVAAAVSASIAMQNDKFAEAKEIAAADVAAIESHIDLLRKQFPSWVK